MCFLVNLNLTVSAYPRLTLRLACMAVSTAEFRKASVAQTAPMTSRRLGGDPRCKQESREEGRRKTVVSPVAN